MVKRFNVFLIIMLCLAALVVLNQEKSKVQLPVNNRETSTPANRLVISQAYDIITLDPALASDTGSLRVITNVYEGLVRFKTGTTTVEPCLAQSWDVSEDGRTWTFNLRRDVMFHDGTPFDARAVEYSIKRQMQTDKNTTTYADFVYAPLEEVEVTDPFTVTFHLKYPYAPFLNNLAMPMAAPVVGPRTPEGNENSPAALPPGTGPFIPVGENDSGILLKANPQYWGAPPGVDELAFYTVANSSNQVDMLLKGQTDIALDITFDEAADLRFAGYPVYRTTGLDICYLGFYTDREPFNNAPVRKAVTQSLDRVEIFKHLGLQQVQTAAGHIPPGVTGYADYAGTGYDPESAARMLREAGYANGLSFTLITYTDPRPYSPGGGLELAEALAWSAARAGINIKVRAYPWDQFKQALQNREGDAFLFGWISDNGDPDNFLYTLLAPDQIENGQNLTRYHSPQLETLLVSGRSTTDEEIRRELYTRAQEVLNDDTPWMVLGHSLHHAAAAPGVRGFALSPTGWHTLGEVTK